MASIRSRAPEASSDRVRRVMRAVPSSDTSIELALRSALHAKGVRFRKDIRPVARIRCKADVVFTKAKVCVFADGCFWHGCPDHFTPPRTNTAWWAEKIRDNIRRDREKTRLLEEAGWTVLRFWEHELASANIEDAAERVTAAIVVKHSPIVLRF